MRFGPDAALRYSYTAIEGYTERGSLAPLYIESQSAQSLQLEIGLHASYAMKLGSMTLTPNVRVAWQHEGLDANPTIASRFASGAGGVFRVRGSEVGRESLLISGGASLQINEGLSTYMSYNDEFLRSNLATHQFNFGMRLEF